MRTLFTIAAVCLVVAPAVAGEIEITADEETGWNVYTITQGETTVRVAPAAGANAFSVVHRGAEYLRVPAELKDLPGVGYGNPILYPTPNRVRGAEFTFEGRTYKFPNNAGGNFIHGLVNRAAFEVAEAIADDEGARVTCALEFVPGDKYYELFPFTHVFRVTIAVKEGSVRWTYEVDNSRGDHNLPFGVALHPYVIYQKSRAETFLQVPASHIMEATRQLPSGKLVELDGHPLDARRPKSLEGYRADDVFFGMTPDQPARVEFHDVSRSIAFHASKEFTHLVVWTPNAPYFGIENQTCSTDAHNLAAQGFEDVAHLQICPPGETRTGFVEYRFDETQVD